MAMALTAWLIAPAPMAWTSTLPWLRITPAMAPATATGFEVADTFSTSTGGLPSAVMLHSPSSSFSVDALDRCGASGEAVNGNQNRVECHRSGGHLETVRHGGNETLEDVLFVHPDHTVPGADHPGVAAVRGALAEQARIRCWHVRVSADDRTHTAVEIPTHRLLFTGRLGVHVDE